ncbi:MAG: hypothetical protein KBD66_00955 [Candidatus Doudnabacteria bacterium]|nr:hypothetical protein [Candidatus Doudnabacteria bacterium]
MQKIFTYWYAGLASASIVSGALLFWIVFQRSPEDIFAHVLFYVFLLVLVYALVCMAEIVVRRRFVVAPLRSTLVASNRQALWLALFVVLLFYTQATGLLSWWVGGSIASLFVCIEVWCNT